MFLIKPLSVHQKMYRVRGHFGELELLFKEFYETKRDEAKKCRNTEEFVAFSATLVAPVRLPLVAGDCLQNMRSSLDYMVWELVKANKSKPTSSNMFPISLKKSGYKRSIELGRLNGISDEAHALIDSFQPCLRSSDERERHMLSVLDSLTNINKHRHILPTMSVSTVTPPVLGPRFSLAADVLDETDPRQAVPRRIITYIAFQDISVAGYEIAATLDALSQYLIEQVFAPFEKFFK